MHIVVAGPERWDVVERFVPALLEELGDEAKDTGALDPAVRERWEERPDRMTIVIAYDDDAQREPIGLLTLTEGFAVYANGAYGVIAEMYVVPQARSRGIGKALIDRAAEIGRARGWSRIDVTGPESNYARNVRFYESCGFRFVGPKLRLSIEK